MGDFLGFTFGGVHSSDLGITRVSGGDRYEEKLQPEITDRTTEVPGLDGVYYFGSDHKERTFDISIGFDSLTEMQFRQLRTFFSTKEIKDLIFDERPYKKYMAKLESPVELSYVCFDGPEKVLDNERDGVRIIDRPSTTSSVVSDVSEGLDITLSEAVYQSKCQNDGTNTFTYQNSAWYMNENVEVSLDEYGITATINDLVAENIGFKITNSTTISVVRERVTPYRLNYDNTQRIYKGEGKISFVCHYPYAKSVFKQLPEESEEWAFSSGILSAADYSEFDKYDNESGIINIYNGGDLPTNFSLYCPFAASHSIKLKYYTEENVLSGQLNIGNITPLDNETGHNDIGFLINTSNNLIQGVQSVEVIDNKTVCTVSKNFYNRYIRSGSFYKIEPNFSSIDGSYFLVTDIEDNIIVTNDIEIFYDYLYY